MKVYKDGQFISIEYKDAVIRLDNNEARKLFSALPYLMGETQEKQIVYQVCAEDSTVYEGYSYVEIFSDKETAEAFSVKLIPFSSWVDRYTVDRSAAITFAKDTRNIYFVTTRGDNIEVSDHDEYRETSIDEYISVVADNKPYVNTLWSSRPNEPEYLAIIAAESEEEAIVLAKLAIIEYELENA